MPAGQPTKYDPSFCDQVIEWGKQGWSKAEMASELNISRASFDNYEKEHPEFLEAVNAAVYFSQAWWERKGREATFNTQEDMTFSASSYSFNMKNRFKADWKDKVENEVSGSGLIVQIVRHADDKDS